MKNEKIENKKNILEKCTRCGGNHYDFYCMYHKSK